MEINVFIQLLLLPFFILLSFLGLDELTVKNNENMPLLTIILQIGTSWGVIDNYDSKYTINKTKDAPAENKSIE